MASSSRLTAAWDRLRYGHTWSPQHLLPKDRYFQGDVTSDSMLIAEGIEGQVSPRSATRVAYQLIGGLRQATAYTGASTIPELQERGSSHGLPPQVCGSPIRTTSR